MLLAKQGVLGGGLVDQEREGQQPNREIPYKNIRSHIELRWKPQGCKFMITTTLYILY